MDAKILRLKSSTEWIKNRNVVIVSQTGRIVAFLFCDAFYTVHFLILIVLLLFLCCSTHISHQEKTEV